MIYILVTNEPDVFTCYSNWLMWDFLEIEKFILVHICPLDHVHCRYTFVLKVARLGIFIDKKSLICKFLSSLITKLHNYIPIHKLCTIVYTKCMPVSTIVQFILFLVCQGL